MLESRSSRTLGGAIGALLALALPACSDDSAGDAGPGGSGGAGPSSASSAAQGGGGAGTTGGAGGAVTEFVVDSFEADTTLILGLPADVTFIAHVSHPDGPDAVTQAIMWDGGQGYPMHGVDPPGTFKRNHTFEQTADPHQGYVIILGQFEDVSGAIAESGVGLQFDPTGCIGRPDPDSCFSCFCDNDPVGCEHYQGLQYDHLYCGSTCSSDCSAFCTSVSEDIDDTSLIDAACAACVPNIADVGAFEDACIADVPVCFSFLTDAYSCPR